MTEITFVRHGNTYWNNEGRSQGYSHNPLSRLGEEQAKIAAERLAKEEWDLFISSDLRRATETADAISEATGMEVDFYDKRIREIGRGKITGMIRSEIEDKYGENWEELDLGIETFEEVRKRGLDFIKDMGERYPDKKLLVVSHGILIRRTLEKLIDEDRGRLENGSITTIKNTSEGWEYVLYNCTKHFEGTEIEPT